MTDYTRFEDVPDGTFDVIYADPPWKYTGDPNKWGAAEKEYKTMTPEELAALPVRRKFRKRGILFMWATGPKLDTAIDLIRAWDLFYRGMSFIWSKTKRNGEVIGAQGVRPSIVKPLAEIVLAASTVKDGRPLPLLDEGIEQMVYAPRGEHSEKPREVRDRIEQLFAPDIRRLEMFARGPAVELWDRFGNEMTPKEDSVLELLHEEKT